MVGLENQLVNNCHKVREPIKTIELRSVGVKEAKGGLISSLKS